jgi:hypothetical protein
MSIFEDGFIAVREAPFFFGALAPNVRAAGLGFWQLHPQYCDLSTRGGCQHLRTAGPHRATNSPRYHHHGAQMANGNFWQVIRPKTVTNN